MAEKPIPHSGSPETVEATPAKIISAATRLFAEKGYDGTSTKEICDAAGVNIASVHYHFESKEGLYRHIIGGFGASSLESAQRVLQPPQSAEELKVRLEMFIRETVESIIKKPELIQIIQREIELPNSQLSDDLFRNIFLKLFESLAEFLNQAKRHKLIRKELDPFFVAALISGYLFHQTRVGRANQKYFGLSLDDATYRNKWIHNTLVIILDGILER